MAVPAPLTREQLVSLATRYRQNRDVRLLLGETKRLRDLVLAIHQQQCKLARYTENPDDAVVLAAIIELTENGEQIGDESKNLRSLHSQEVLDA